MKIAVINEVSASLRNEDIVKALHKTTDAEILNVGMKTPEQMPSLTYIHTSYMAAILLNTGSCDFVVGGCGTGQGFLNGVLQFPGIVCGLIVEPLDDVGEQVVMQRVFQLVTQQCLIVCDKCK